MTPEKLFELTAPRFPSQPFVVALSGGPDSAVAAWLAGEIAVRTGGDVTLIHVDHGWAASAEMRQAAEAVAAHVRLPLEVGVIAAAATETEARQQRLDALVELAGGRSIVTGHHRDDDVETIVGNLLRGAGATGLSGIPAVRPPFHRPLLDISRSDIRRVAEALELPFVDDPANVDQRHRRSRIRHDVLPLLEAAEPGVTERLWRTGVALAHDDAALQARADAIAITVGRDGAVSVPYGVLRTVERAVAARVVRRALRLAHPPYPGAAADVARILQLHEGSVSLSDDVDAVRDGPFVTLVAHGEASVAAAEPQPLAVPGSVEFGAFRISSEVVSGGSVVTIGRNRVVVASADDLIVRGPEPGDRIDIAGGSKLVSDALSEARIPLRRRKHWPVVVSRGRIVWLARVRVAHVAARRSVSGDAVQLVAERL